MHARALSAGANRPRHIKPLSSGAAAGLGVPAACAHTRFIWTFRVLVAAPRPSAQCLSCVAVRLRFTRCHSLPKQDLWVAFVQAKHCSKIKDIGFRWSAFLSLLFFFCFSSSICCEEPTRVIFSHVPFLPSLPPSSPDLFPCLSPVNNNARGSVEGGGGADALG